MMKPHLIILFAAALALTTLPASAQTKWISGLSIPVCPNPQMRESECERTSSGKVEVVSKEKDYLGREIFLTRVDGVGGFISGYYFNVPGYLVDEDPKVSAKKAKAKAKAAKAECDRRGGIGIGMSAAQVRASCWGKPSRINETINAHGKHEQWVYGSSYVYLDNGVVTSIQQSR
ncbi:MAG: hypothetical protein WBF99_12465 [Xanthobacteraceae bacterium]